MAATITDVSKDASAVGINGVSITNGANATGNELDRGIDTQVGEVTALLSVTGFVADPNDDGYMTVALAPLDGTGGTLYDDVVAPAVVPVDADALYQVPVMLVWPAGAQYAKVVVGNQSGQDTDANAVSVELRWQAVTT